MIYPENIKATISDVEYTWCGTFGSVISSKENNVSKNSVRMIGNVIFYARRIEEGWFYDTVHWCPQQKITAEWIRDFKRDFCGV